MSYCYIAVAALVLGSKLDNFVDFAWFGSSSKRNKVEDRTATLQYSANNPLEDRFAIHSFKNVEGFTAIVFDGHAGWQVAEYASKTLHLRLDQELEKLQKES